jgi:hypothetical protein
MNGIPEKYSLKLSQTSKGVFYVDKIEVNEDTPQACVDSMKNFADKTVNLLKDLNKDQA